MKFPSPRRSLPRVALQRHRVARPDTNPMRCLGHTPVGFWRRDGVPRNGRAAMNVPADHVVDRRRSSGIIKVDVPGIPKRRVALPYVERFVRVEVPNMVLKLVEVPFPETLSITSPKRVKSPSNVMAFRTREITTRRITSRKWYVRCAKKR